MTLFSAEVDNAIVKLLGQIGSLIETETTAHRKHSAQNDSLVGQETRKIEAETSRLKAKIESDSLYMKKQAFDKALELMDEAGKTKDVAKANELRELAKSLLRGY